MGWFRRDDGRLEPGEEKPDTSLKDVEFKPEQFKEEITTSFKNELESFKTAHSEAMKPMQELAASIQQERQERIAAENKRKEQAKKEADGDFSERLMLDPDSAIEEKLKGTKQALYMLASREARREVLGDREYYHGDIKQKVDSLIDSLPLEQQASAGSIDNCYSIVMFKNQKEIAEGKIKARNNTANFENNGTGGHSGKENTDSSESLNAEEKDMAKKFGMTEKEWATSRKELSYV